MNWNSGIKRGLAGVVAMVMIALSPGAAMVARADYTNVFGRPFDNDEKYLVIRKDPVGKVGKTMNIPIIIEAPKDLDEVWVGLSEEIDSFLYLPEDGGIDSNLRNQYPFEINESTFEPHKLGKS